MIASIRSLVIAALLSAPCLVASAQEDGTSVNTLFVSVSGARSDLSDTEPARSVSAGFERSAGDVFFGAAIGAGGSSVAFRSIVEIKEAEGWLGEVWWGINSGDTVFSLSAGYGLESADGTVTVRLGNGQSLQPGTLSGDVRSLGLTASVMRNFGETIIVSPGLSISFSSSETEADIRAARGLVFTSANEASGYTAAASLGVSRDFGERTSGAISASVLTTDNAAASRFTSRRGGVFAPEAAETEESATWGEVSASLSFDVAPGIMLSPSLGTTIGLDDESYYGSLTVSRSF